MSKLVIGTFYGVGVGPGDPELLTLKAVRVLSEVDWIFCPLSAARPGGFAARILERLGLPGKKFRGISLCMSHERRKDREAYQRAAHEILVELREGKSVAWVTQGDPLLYSTFLYVYHQVRSDRSEVRTEIVPGITSLQAAAARAGVPVAHLDEKVAIVPAAYGIENLSVLLDQFATVFLVKIHRVLDRLFEQLARLPVPVAAWYVEQVGTLEERVVTDVSTLRGQTLPYFSLVILRQEKPARNEATGVEAS